MQTKNLVAHSVVINNIYTTRTKAVDIRFHWLRCIDVQGYFMYYWRPLKQNLVDYWTKHHPESHHTVKRYEVFTPTCQLELLQIANTRTENRG